MELAHEHNGHGAYAAHDAEHAHHGPRTLPAVLTAPAAVSAWRTRMLMVAAVATVISVVFLFLPLGKGHALRAYLLGIMLTFTFAGGGTCLLMLQYVSGGKWGLLLRRPLEAMSRTVPLVAGLFAVTLIPFFGKHLWQWAAFPDAKATANAVAQGMMTEEQKLCADAKHAMLSPISMVVEWIIVFGILFLFSYLLNKWSEQRDADPAAGSQGSFDYWRTKFENLSGPGILIYVTILTIVAIVWVMSLDVTWYSSVWGLKFLVGQGYAVLSLSILSVILLSRYEPIKTILRTTEQHDLGKFLFGFVMLNIYLTFAEFLIMWSGNVPDEIPWYIHRVGGGWWVATSCDFIFHWLIPFSLLLSRDLKRSKSKMIKVTCWMLFARAFDLFWLIEPNFPDAHWTGGSHWLGDLQYLTVPVAVMAVWAYFYLGELMKRPLVVTNDPHLAEILEPEHAH